MYISIQNIFVLSDPLYMDIFLFLQEFFNGLFQKLSG